jgi:hypothetical protein
MMSHDRKGVAPHYILPLPSGRGSSHNTESCRSLAVAALLTIMSHDRKEVATLFQAFLPQQGSGQPHC